MLLSEWPALPLHAGACWPVLVVPAPEAAQERPVEEREAAARPILPADAASPAVASAAAARQAICARCSRPFTAPPLRPGPPRRLCDDCRQRRPIRQANGEAEPAPELAPEPEPAPEPAPLAYPERSRYSEAIDAPPWVADPGGIADARYSEALREQHAGRRW